MIDMDKMELLHNENRSCFEDVTVTVSGWYHRHYEYMFMNSWVFHYDYNDTESCIGNRLYCRVPDEYENFIEYSGIERHLVKFQDINDGIAKIKEELMKDHIVSMTAFDLFSIPWTSDYKKSHGGHSFLIKRYDEGTETLICMDPYLLIKEAKLDKEHFINGNSGKLVVYSLIHDEKDELNINDAIKATVNRLFLKEDGMNAFDLMRRFADDIEETYDLQKEMKGYETWFSIPIYKNLQMIGRRRMQYSEFLNFISNKVEERKELLEISEELYRIGKLWDKLKISFGKECVVKDSHWVRQKSPDKIRKIAQLEEECARRLNALRIGGVYYG